MDRQEETSKLNNYEVTAGRGLMNVVFSWSLEDVLNPHLHQNQVGDRIALTDTKPKCVDRFNSPRNSYLVANVHRSRGNNLSILSSKLIDRVGYMQITVYLVNMTATVRVWKSSSCYNLLIQFVFVSYRVGILVPFTLTTKNATCLVHFRPSVLRFVWVKSSVRITIHEHFRATQKERNRSRY
ncbi:hypothetical protein FF1_031991 [Malus domestica]